MLIGAVPPLMLKTAANPGGLPMEAFDQIRAGVPADRSQFFKDLSAPFYGANRPGAEPVLGSATPLEASWSRSNSFCDTLLFKRPNAILAASSGFDRR